MQRNGQSSAAGAPAGEDVLKNFGRVASGLDPDQVRTTVLELHERIRALEKRAGETSASYVLEAALREAAEVRTQAVQAADRSYSEIMRSAQEDADRARSEAQREAQELRDKALAAEAARRREADERLARAQQEAERIQRATADDANRIRQDAERDAERIRQEASRLDEQSRLEFERLCSEFMEFLERVIEHPRVSGRSPIVDQLAGSDTEPTGLIPVNGQAHDSSIDEPARAGSPRDAEPAVAIPALAVEPIADHESLWNGTPPPSQGSYSSESPVIAPAVERTAPAEAAPPTPRNPEPAPEQTESGGFRVPDWLKM